MIRLKKQWKIVTGIFLACILFGITYVFVSANTTVKITMVNSDKSIPSGTIRNLSVNMSGLDNDADPDPANIHWTTEKGYAVQIVDSTGASVADPAGNSIYVKGAAAGTSKITATYYSKMIDANGVDTGNVSIASTTSIDMTVPISVQIADPSMTERTLNVGEMIDLTANTSLENPMIISSSNEGVVKINNDSATHATILTVGGGSSTITVTTRDSANNSLLTYKFDVRVKIEFDKSLYNTDLKSKLFVLKGINERYMIPSNVASPSTAGILLISDDEKLVKTYPSGEIEGLKAGVTKVKIGIKASDVDGNQTVYNDSTDTVIVVVPFAWANDTDTMNVGDQFQLETNGIGEKLSWNTSDNTVLTVDTNGLVTAVGQGTATITVSRPQSTGNQNNIYDEIFTIEKEIKVIDSFSLSTTTQEININESFDLKALATDKNAKITFKAYNVNEVGGEIPTYDIVKTKQSKDGLTLTVTGAAAGTVRIVATQNIMGLIKTAECVVYVRTPVNNVKLNPSSMQINRGETAVIQLIFEPENPYNNQVLWTTSNKDVIQVAGNSATATVTAKKGGKATVSVITMDGLKVGSCEIDVREPVTGLTLNETKVDSFMSVGSYQLEATVKPAGDGVNRNVTWMSSNEKVLKVDKNGLVKFVAPGYASVICQTEDNAYVATCNFYICIPVEELKLDYHELILSNGQHTRITAEILPLTATNRTVEWSSSNENVCVVDTNGQITAVGTGTATILCKSLDGRATDMCNVYVKQPATKVVVNSTNTTVRKGAVFWLNATVFPENADNKMIEWTSTNEEIAKVDKDGKVTTLNPGTCSIVATNPDTGLNDFCLVTVTQPVTGISLNSDYQEMWVGSKYAIIPIIEPLDAENKKVKYESTDSSVASVNEHGVVTALKGGKCTIIVTTDECQLTATVDISVKEYVSNISLSEKNFLMNIGSDKILIAEVTRESATNKDVIWTSSDPNIVSVDDAGYLKANNYGRVVITATAADGSGKSDSAIVRVIEPVSTIKIEPDSVTMLVGDSHIVKAVVYPEAASIKNVVWETSDPKVATVDSDGEIFAVGPGKCKVTAISTDSNEVKGSCSVYVNPVVRIQSLRINSKELTMLTNKSRKLSAIVTPKNTTESYSWYSTDTSVVVVDQDGTITTVGPGTAEVIVSGGLSNIEGSCIIHAMALNQTYMKLGQYDSNVISVIGTDKKVTWHSENSRIAEVKSDGTIVGKLCGTTKVTATVDGKTMTCTVQVVPRY